MQSVEHTVTVEEVNEEGGGKRPRVDPGSATPELSAISAIASMSTMSEYTTFEMRDANGNEKVPGEEEDVAKGGDMKQMAKQRKREKDRVRAHQKRVQYREQSSELKRLRDQVNAGMNEHGVTEIIGVIKEILGDVELRDMASQLRTLGSVVGNARALIEALPHNSDLRRPITKWLVRNLSPSEACRALGLSRASYYRAFHSKEEKLMANASGYHHKRHHSIDDSDGIPNPDLPEADGAVQATEQSTADSDSAHTLGAMGVTEHPEQVEQPAQATEHPESLDLQSQIEYHL